MSLHARCSFALLVVFVGLFTVPAAQALELFGENTTHDPSTIIEEDGVYWTFGTGNGTEGMVARYSTDLINWQAGPTVFPIGTWPSWVVKFEGVLNSVLFEAH